MNFLTAGKIKISMLFIAITLLGIASYRQLPLELLPNAELPQLYVSIISQTDVDPVYTEQQIIVPLESAIRTAGGVEKIESRTGSNRSTIRVEFKKNVNFRLTSLKLTQKINETAKTFPDNFTVTTQKIDVNRMNTGFMLLQVRGSGGTDRVRSMVDKEITSDLENINGIAAVSVYGGRGKVIEVQLDPNACQALNITPQRISQMLAQNTQEKVFVGNVHEPNRLFFVHINSPFTNVADLENIVVAKGPVLLKDVARVFFDLKEETSFSRVNGKDALSVVLTNDSQVNLIELSKRTLSTIDRLNEKLRQQDIEITVVENSAATMEKNIGQIIWLAITGGILAIIILWFFLKNIRIVAIIALSIPISIYAAFNLFYAFGITINSLTLIGITLAVGMLLDNSVVVLENIYRLSGQGSPPEIAVTQGTKEVWKSVLAATLTTITVFLPFVFSDNFFIKLLGLHIGVSIISTLGISLLVAMLFIPMATYLILKSRKNKSVFYERISIRQRAVQIYLVLLKTCMRNPGTTIIGAIVLLFIILFLSLSLTMQQMKTAKTDRFAIMVTMPSGASLESTDKVVRTVENLLEDLPERKELICNIQETEASLTLVLKDNFEKIRKKNIAAVKEAVAVTVKDIKGGDITVGNTFGGGNESGGDELSGMGNFLRVLGIGDNRERIVIKGNDYDLMQLVVEDLKYYLDQQDFISNTKKSSQNRQPELLMHFDPVLLVSYGITQNEIAQGLRSLEPEMQSGSTFKVGEEDYDIVIRNLQPGLTEEEPAGRDKTVEDLAKVQIENTEGGLHLLSDLASMNYSRGRSQINRLNQDKHIELYYNFTNDIQKSKSLLEGYRADIDNLIANYNLPAGVAIEVFHEENEFADFQFLFFAAFLLIFMIMAAVFESLTKPFVLLLSIPLAAIGSLLALLLTGNSLMNTNTLTGFLILLGVVVNNSIILIDYSNILRKRGYRLNRSLITAGLSRVRPILITSITTIVAMFPLAMGESEYSSLIGAPFAITVIGGLACSTLLTLVVVPTACMGMENALAWYAGLSRKIKISHATIFAAGIYMIYLYADGILWQILFTILLVALIPGITYFALSSLRRAQSTIIDPQSEIKIVVRNLVKIYEREGHFIRQWNSGNRLQTRLGLGNKFHSLKDFSGIVWQVALFGFLVYFTYFYLSKWLWIFLFSWLVYAFALHLWNCFYKYISFKNNGKQWTNRLNNRIKFLIPVPLIITMFVKLENPRFVIIIGILWYICLLIRRTSYYLYENQVNIERIKGSYSGIRKTFFRFVKTVPLIGNRHRPFKALQGISLEINTGMFGLLGPNGAGKSTLMRIICGILEQSYGKIMINGLDTQIYREELQSLIGFLPQEFGTYENLTSGEFLEYQAILKGLTDAVIRRQRIEYVLKSVNMLEHKDEKIGSFSGGMKQRIGIALILLNLPRILIVDEPTAGLDPRERIRFRNLLSELSKDRIVIFSTHIIDDISSSCNQVAVIDHGKLKYFGKPMEMRHIADGKIWKFNVSKTDFEEQLDKSRVIHHIQSGETIQVRYLSAGKPVEEAIPVDPTTEDAYLCLLKETFDSGR
ncbi:MAG: efflux RND transporter permease subunit [Dysgonamonadaceae bacterium]|jgi:multidrug efflux pump subunit AcrB/ABC-type multidrug transport system ATPase subunit|nr:efflux RND transporter permease subunit [Dysgonamonadaceae bacterium]